MYGFEASWTSAFTAIIGGVIIAAIWEQWSLQNKRGKIPGPRFVLPFLGSMLEIVQNPFEYYERQRNYGSISWSAALGKLILFSRDSEITRTVFGSPESFNLWLTMGAKKILGENNIAFMTGDPHKELRKRILPLFTPRALSIFLRVQETCIRRSLKEWNDNNKGKVFETRPLVRDMNVETSTHVFVGPYVDDNLRKRIADLFWEMNAGFLSFPINLPGTQLWRAVKARETLVVIFQECLSKAKSRMATPGEQPECMLDIWVEEGMNSGKPFDDDKEIAFHFMDFLFASQDASTSSIVWTIAVLAKHKDILEKVIEEQNRVRPKKEDGSEEQITHELINQMTYTKQVVKEILRYRPPATMVPHIAIKDSKVGDIDIKKGTVILPSIWSAHLDDFPEPEKFDPERFNQERERNPQTTKSFLAFGYGPHRCIGIQYALNHLILFASELTRHYQWSRQETVGGDEIVFLPTIFPKDGVLIKMNEI